MITAVSGWLIATLFAVVTLVITLLGMVGRDVLTSLRSINRWIHGHPRLAVVAAWLFVLIVMPRAAPDPDPINTATTKNIMPGLADDFFKADPLLEFMKNRHHVYPGGPQIQENLIYKPMIGGRTPRASAGSTSPSGRPSPGCCSDPEVLRGEHPGVPRGSGDRSQRSRRRCCPW
jgi:hypothetical protein